MDDIWGRLKSPYFDDVSTLVEFIEGSDEKKEGSGSKDKEGKKRKKRKK